MLDVIATAVTEFLLAILPGSRRGRIIMWIGMGVGVAAAAATLVITLSD